MFLDWTNWTFWVTALALIAFGFNLRVIYEQWRFWKIRKRPDEEIRELTQRLRTATERLNKANARGFKVSLAPIEHPRFGQMRVILGELRHVFLRLQRSG